ncbi:MAG: hypothetical protein ACREIT_00100 [Tepidisphaeraceae bacterium]
MSNSKPERFHERSPMPDNDFCQAVGVTNLRTAAAVAVVRRAVGKLCNLPSEAIYPDDFPKNIASLVKWPPGWDAVGVVMAIEDELGMSLPGSFEPVPFEGRIFGLRLGHGPTKMGDWILATAERLAALESVVLDARWS